MKTLSNAGYVFNFSGHGAFDPEGKIAGQPSPEAIKAHNEAVAAQEMALMRQTGRGILYLFYTDGVLTHVGTWASEPKDRLRVYTSKVSRNNWGAKRTDVWFYYPDYGSVWHGVNIGDNDILRCKRTKNK